ncbi:MAG: alkaline phosphatase [Candidatus Atribacteria bacterium]|nr:alkaline phosphatase [Candidatus Atribacteria bacterium]
MKITKFTIQIVFILVLFWSMFLVSSGLCADEIPSARYVFFFIGDGMGLASINAAEIYTSVNQGSLSEPAISKLNFTKFPILGLCTTYAADGFITDSASAGTAIATGHKTNDGVINMDPTKTVTYTTLAEMAKEKGMKVGIVSSVSIDHATPACFYAHQSSRKNYYDIACELATSHFDYFGGGGFLQPQGKEKDQPDVLDIARKNGFTVVTSKDEILALTPGQEKIIAINPSLDEEKAFPYAIDAKQDDLTLADFTRKGIELLDNPNGFFFMIEGGKIDWAAHANDAKTAIADILALQKAVDEAIQFAQTHPEDTLIVITADHETGGMSIGNAGMKYSTNLHLLTFQKISYQAVEQYVEELRKTYPEGKLNLAEMMDFITENFGVTLLTDADRNILKNQAEEGDKTAVEKLALTLTPDEIQSLSEALLLSLQEPKERPQDDQSYLHYGGYEPLSITLTRILDQKAGIGWTTYSHTGIPVPVYAQGAGQELFAGYYDNTDLFTKFTMVMGLEPVGVGK